MPTLRFLVRVCVASAVALSFASIRIGAQSVRPTISGVSPRTVAPRQIVTIRGSDLLPDTTFSSTGLMRWIVTVVYRPKYGGSLRQLPVTGTDNVITFEAASDMPPEGVTLLYTPEGVVNTFLPILSADRAPSVGALHVRMPPDLVVAPGVSTAGSGGTFNVVTPGVVALSGRHLLRLPATFSGTRSLSEPTLIDRTTLAELSTVTTAGGYGPPTVTFNGVSLPVSSARYDPTIPTDIVLVSLASLPHNASGFLKLVTGEGADSVKLTVARPPVNGRVLQSIGGVELPVPGNQLVRGTNYLIRVDNRSVTERTGSGINPSVPSLRLGTQPIIPRLVGNDTTLLFFQATTNTFVAGGELILSHPGGALSLGTFTLVAPPSALAVTGAVLAPSEIIGGASSNLTVSVSPTPTDFSTAGSLVISIPPSLAAAIAPITPVPITANPMIIPIRTAVSAITLTGSIGVRHSADGATQSSSVNVTIRPPRPTAITIADSVAGGRPVTGSVTFDLPGAATVLLSSSDPSVATVPASITRSGTTAAFTVTTVAVSAPSAVTIFASVNGTSVSQPLVLRPGRLISIDPPGPMTGGQTGSVAVAFDIAVTGKPVTLTSNDTALVINSTSVTGTSRAVSFTTSPNLSTSRTVTITASADGVQRTGTVQLAPMQLTAVTAAPTSGVGGSSTAVTLRLSRPAIVQQFILLTSSDTTVVRVPLSAQINVGADVTVLPLTFTAGGTGTRTTTVTATLMSRGNVGAPPVGSRTITLTVTP